MTFRRALHLMVLLGLVAIACGKGGADPGQQVNVGIPAVNAAQASLLPTDAAELPALDPSTYGELLGQLRGTPVLVNIWGSWCGPCRAEAPDLASAHRTYGERVQFLGLDILDARGPARAFMEEFGWTYPSFFDAPASIRDSLGVVGQPVTLFYDASGTLVGTWLGAIPAEELTSRLDALVETA